MASTPKIIFIGKNENENREKSRPVKNAMISGGK